jgi:hypothetical protein
VVLDSVNIRVPDITIHKAAVDVSHSAVPIEGVITTCVIKKTTKVGREVAVEVTSSGLVLQVYDREYYKEFVED